MHAEHTNDFIEDITTLEQATVTKRTLIDTKKRLGMVLDFLPLGLLIHQEQGILFANQTACMILGQSQESLIGQHLLDFASMAQADTLSAFFTEAFGSSDIQQVKDVKIPDLNGTEKLYRAIAATLPWEGTPVVQIVLQDITAERANEKQLEQLSTTDQLTGTYNRRGFIQYAKYLSTERECCHCSVIFFDVDHFKKVNDTYGHAAGDIALREIVLRTETILNEFNRTKKNHTPDAKLARMGGEEFAIIVPNSHASTTAILAEEIRIDIAGQPVGSLEKTFTVQVSLGVTCGDLSKESIDDILRSADNALYAAKNSGRNKTVLSDDVSVEMLEAPYQPISRRTHR